MPNNNILLCFMLFLIRTSFCQIRNYNSHSTTPLGLRSEYFPPMSKPIRGGANVTAIVFGNGTETDNNRATLFRKLGFSTHIACLPFLTVYSYDQAAQKGRDVMSNCSARLYAREH